jgi:acyl-coenzyme A thioesterase PaaI-like protein
MSNSADDALLEGLRQLGDGLPFNQHLGVEVQAIAPGRVTARLRADDRITNHLGGVHAIAELAPVELAGALAASSRLRTLLERGFVPVVGSLQVRYVAPATGELTAIGIVGEDVVAPAVAAADAGERPRVVADVEVTDEHGTTVAVAELTFVYLDMSAAGQDRSSVT